MLSNILVVLEEIVLYSNCNNQFIKSENFKLYENEEYSI